MRGKPRSQRTSFTSTVSVTRVRAGPLPSARTTLGLGSAAARPLQCATNRSPDGDESMSTIADAKQ